MHAVNCKNCGACLTYGTNEYESTAKCEYCGSEYHIDRLGKIEEYKVKMDIMGSVREFYIEEVTVTDDPVAFAFCDTNLTYKWCCREAPKMEIKLIEIRK